MNTLDRFILVALAMVTIIALPHIIEKTASEWEPQPDAYERIRAAVKKNWGF